MKHMAACVCPRCCANEKRAIRLDRAKRGAMPLLFNHDMDDPIGMIDSARIVDGRLEVELRKLQSLAEFGTSPTPNKGRA